MENTGVICDVCNCTYNEGGCKCKKEQIKVTEHTNCASQSVETPHFCESYQER